jgi:hypothetical protein
MGRLQPAASRTGHRSDPQAGCSLRTGETRRGVPGDVAGCGVLKGSGCLYWLKLLAILEPAFVRRVIGFDTFSEFSPDQREDERAAIEDFVASSGFAGVRRKRDHGSSRSRGSRRPA